jgi:hypothetical protein
MIGFPVNTEVIGKLGDASSAIATHASFLAIGIEIYHFEIITFEGIQQHETIGTDAEATVTEVIDLGRGQTGISLSPVIGQNKIIARSLVFIKMKFHQI